ncbi:hypothetical protein [Pseudoxanthomonas sp. Soil82]|uniref:hypothetical protein n=1 Tax=Pseudoxanthomonas sp. Soil82 TaxID=3157341 RepID=UPI00338EA15F
MNSLTLHEAAQLLLSLSAAERDLFAAQAATLALRHGNLEAGLRAALEEIARDRREGGAHG